MPFPIPQDTGKISGEYKIKLHYKIKYLRTGGNYRMALPRDYRNRAPIYLPPIHGHIMLCMDVGKGI